MRGVFLCICPDEPQLDRYCCGSSGGSTCRLCHVGSGISPAVIF
jgi:hypothetical protein